MASPDAVSTVTSSASTGSDQVTGEARRPAAAAAAVMEERKRKRKESNRLSAQRSRARMQQRLDELRAQNGAVALAARKASRRSAAVDAENELLRAQSIELAARLRSLDDLAQCLQFAPARPNYSSCRFESLHLHHETDGSD